MTTRKKKKSQPYVAETGEKIIGISGGESGKQIEITGLREVEEVRDLIRKRAEIGRAISKKLIDRGLTSASAEDPTKIIPN